MKVSRAEAAQNRERIIETAARLFRERGFDGIGVADLMKAAGLTHGGFYGNFTSKEDLMAQACARALAGSVDTLRELARDHPEQALAAAAAAYLSPAHRDHPGEGCALAALGAEAGRHPGAVQAAFTEGVRPVVEILTQLAPGESEGEQRKHALVVYASMVGAMVLARAVDDAALSDEVMEAVLGSIVRAPARKREGADCPAPS